MPDAVATTRSPAAAAATATASNHSHPSSMEIPIEGREEDELLSRSEYLTREEVLRRRARRVKQLARIYRDHYWSLMEQLKLKYREYYWEYGKSPFQEDHEENNTNNNNHQTNQTNQTNNSNDNNNPNNNNNNLSSDLGSSIENGRCKVHGCKSKAMALTKFCHMHILSDPKQKLYKACSYAIKSSPTGPIVCSKPILKSTVPSYCSLHFQKAEKHITKALKTAGLNISSTSKLSPKFHVIAAEYVNQIQNKRRAARRASSSQIVEVKEERSC